MSVKLDRRLSRCADLVSRGGIALDVGTDHALLPCYLVENGISRSAFASDVADGPLLRARITVGGCGLSEKVQLLKSDGFKDIPDSILGSVTDVIIAGMGGELIAEILKDYNKLRPGVNIIAQPNSRPQALRRFFAENGFEIRCETAVRDKKMFYPIICAAPSDKIRQLSDFEAEVGFLNPRDPESREYLLKEAARLRAAAMGMESAASGSKRGEAISLLSLADEIEKFTYSD